MKEVKKSTFYAFYFLIMLFFLWGLLTSMNDILVPHLKSAFTLKNWQAQLIQFFFFMAYFVMSIPSGWLIRKIGYQKGIVVGLSLMGLACLAFIPATYIQVYALFLVALFLLASGITILQVAANPYVAVLGKPEMAASRLNLAQGFNSLGHTIAPLIGALFILQNTEIVEISRLRLPYTGLGIALLLLAGLFFIIRLPVIDSDENEETKSLFRIFDHKHLYLGAIAIFCYVGAEISIGSFIIEYFKTDSSILLDSISAGKKLAFYWGGAMVGRFLGSIALSEKRSLLAMISIPLIAIVVVKLVLWVNGIPFSESHGFDILLVLNFLAFYFGTKTSNGQLALFAAINMILLAVTMATGGNIAIWSVIGIGLFNSIMWSNIFTLAIEKLGQFTSIGSSLLVLMIVGGAILPLLQGFVADIPAFDIKYSFVVPLLAYAYIVFYGAKGSRRESLLE